MTLLGQERASERNSLDKQIQETKERLAGREKELMAIQADFHKVCFSNSTTGLV